MRLGIDVDGVLANFNESFVERVVAVTGMDLFPTRPFEPQTWDYPEAYGYTADETSRVWENVKADPYFWAQLPVYATTRADLDYLYKLQAHLGRDIYFITSRPGVVAKHQTERWLRRYGMENPTVLISSDKGACARALNLDAYVDDYWKNITAVKAVGIQQVLVFDRPWNRDTAKDHELGVKRVSRLYGAFD